MWVQRTPEEVCEWKQTTEDHARSQGWVIGAVAWAAASVLAAAGVWMTGRSTYATQRAPEGGFWFRLVVFAVLLLPVFWVVSRKVRKSELESQLRRVICPKCDTAGEHAEGQECECGGVFISASRLRWVELEESSTSVAAS